MSDKNYAAAMIALALYSILSTYTAIKLYKGYEKLTKQLYERINFLNNEVISLIKKYKNHVTIGDLERLRNMERNEVVNE